MKWKPIELISTLSLNKYRINYLLLLNDLFELIRDIPVAIKIHILLKFIHNVGE